MAVVKQPPIILILPRTDNSVTLFWQLWFSPVNKSTASMEEESNLHSAAQIFSKFTQPTQSCHLSTLSFEQPFQRLPHGLPSIRSSSTSPGTASSGVPSISLDNSWQLYKAWYNFHFRSIKMLFHYSVIPLFCIPHFTASLSAHCISTNMVSPPSFCLTPPILNPLLTKFYVATRNSCILSLCISCR